MEEIDIVIVGGGIAGLATSLALHRKGIKSVVMERGETLRTEGGGITILPNGWRALHQLGLAHFLRPTSLLITKARTVWVEKGKHREFAMSISDESRCIKRMDLLRALADALPQDTIRFGSQVLSIKLDETTSFPVLHFSDGTSVKAKVLIGCDGANSIVAEFLELNPKKTFPSRSVRGFTLYRDGHGFPHELLRMKIGNVLGGRLPMNDKLVYWFTGLHDYPERRDRNVARDRESIAELALEAMDGFSEDWKEMVRDCDVQSLTLTHLTYRSPWDVASGRFRRGNVTVTGDAMHVMGPFLGQGGSAALEDAVVLARRLSRKLCCGDVRECPARRVGEALDEYVRERRARLVGLSTQTYLTGRLLHTQSRAARLLLLLLLMVLFGRSQVRHTRYDCGRL